MKINDLICEECGNDLCVICGQCLSGIHSIFCAIENEGDLDEETTKEKIKCAINI